MTSNLGSTGQKTSSMGFSTGAQSKAKAESEYEQMKTRAMDAVKRSFRPEFINRIDNILVFRSLQEGEIAQIANLLAADLQKRLAAQEITLELDESVGKLLAEAGFDAEYGARPLKRAIVRLLEDPLSEALLAQTFKPGDTVYAYAEGGAVKFSKDKPEIKSAAQSAAQSEQTAANTEIAANAEPVKNADNAENAKNTENTAAMQENATAEAKDSSKESDKESAKESDDSGKDEK
jgi:hypothetical protein